MPFLQKVHSFAKKFIAKKAYMCVRRKKFIHLRDEHPDSNGQAQHCQLLRDRLRRDVSLRWTHHGDCDHRASAVQIRTGQASGGHCRPSTGAKYPRGGVYSASITCIVRCIVVCGDNGGGASPTPQGAAQGACRQGDGRGRILPSRGAGRRLHVRPERTPRRHALQRLYVPHLAFQFVGEEAGDALPIQPTAASRSRLIT